MAKPQTGQSQSAPAWRWMGERGLRVDTGAATLACYEQLVASHMEELEDIIPADGSILLILRPGAVPSDLLWSTLATPAPDYVAASDARHVLPLVLGEKAGPDLAFCAAYAGLTETEFIAQFVAIEFRVAFLGFQPGFPYLAGLPPHWAMPRRTTPRVGVPSGSVALGGSYAGIYPAAGPGGWHLVGQTDALLFDPRRSPPALLAVGDRVRFEVRP